MERERTSIHGERREAALGRVGPVHRGTRAGCNRFFDVAEVSRVAVSTFWRYFGLIHEGADNVPGERSDERPYSHPDPNPLVPSELYRGQKRPGRSFVPEQPEHAPARGSNTTPTSCVTPEPGLHPAAWGPHERGVWHGQSADFSDFARIGQRPAGDVLTGETASRVPAIASGYYSPSTCWRQRLVGSRRESFARLVGPSTRRISMRSF